MCDMIDRFIKQGREEGLAEGREEGREEGIEMGRFKSLRALIDNGHMSLEKAMDMLDFSEEEKKSYKLTIGK